MTATFLRDSVDRPHKMMDCACIYSVGVSVAFVSIRRLTDTHCTRLGTDGQAGNGVSPRSPSSPASGNSYGTPRPRLRAQWSTCQLSGRASPACPSGAPRGSPRAGPTPAGGPGGTVLRVPEACVLRAPPALRPRPTTPRGAHSQRLRGKAPLPPTRTPPLSVWAGITGAGREGETSQVWLGILTSEILSHSSMETETHVLEPLQTQHLTHRFPSDYGALTHCGKCGTKTIVPSISCGDLDFEPMQI